MSAIVAAMTQNRVGRPSGLLMNPKAGAALLGRRPQSWLAKKAMVSPAHLSGLMAGTKGATPDVADRIAAALSEAHGYEIDPAALFPELCEFRTSVRHFVASAVA